MWDCADLAAFEQVAQAARALQLAGMRARGVDPVVERPRRAAQRVQRERADDIGGVGQESARRPSSRQPMASIACVPLMRLMPSLGCRSIGSMPGAPQRLAAGEDCALELRFAFADQDQRHVGERSQIARRAHAALRRHDGRDAAIQQIAEPLGDQRPDAREALREDVGADQHHGAHDVARQRIADAGAVGADHVALQLVEIFAGNADVGQQADAGIDGVDRVVAGGQPVDERARALPSARRRRGQRRTPADRRASDAADVGDGQPMAPSSSRGIGASVPLLAGRDQLFDVDQFGRDSRRCSRRSSIRACSSSSTALRSDASER